MGVGSRHHPSQRCKARCCVSSGCAYTFAVTRTATAAVSAVPAAAMTVKSRPLILRDFGCQPISRQGPIWFQITKSGGAKKGNAAHGRDKIIHAPFGEFQR